MSVSFLSNVRLGVRCSSSWVGFKIVGSGCGGGEGKRTVRNVIGGSVVVELGGAVVVSLWCGRREFWLG